MAALTWNQLLSDGQRQWLMVSTGLQHTVLPKPEMISRSLETSPGKNPVSVESVHNRVISQRFNCFKPDTEAITEAPVNQVYSWTDASGNRHFSDQPATGYRNQDLSQQYSRETQYFNLQVMSPDGEVMPLLKEQLNRDVMAIYRYLTGQLGLDHLRKVTVNLKVFNQPRNYTAYQKVHAPNLLGSAGFYSAIDNEAVVLLHRDPEITRRIARHEATHVIMAGLYGMTPIWLNEGLAEAFADYQNTALSRQFDWQQDRLSLLRNMLNSDTLLPLGILLELDPRRWQRSDPRVVYPTAWALVRFMLDNHHAKKVLLAILRQLANEPCSAIVAKNYIKNYYPDGLIGFEQEWQVWLRQHLAKR